MDSEEIKKEVKVDNSAFRDRFRFLFSANDNIICERFFKINKFNTAALYSDELKATIETIVELIQNDLASKSRIYTWYTTTTPVKLTGFLPNGEGFRYITPDTAFAEYPEPKVEEKTEDVTPQPEKLDPYAVTFKFEFQMAQKIETNPEDNKPIFSDYKSIYTAIWDGTVYPKDIRNSVDLTNSVSQFRGWDVNTMNFAKTLAYRMVNGRQDLVYDIIKRICDTTSGDGKTYTGYTFYGGQKRIAKADAKGFRKLQDVKFEKPNRDKYGNVVTTDLLDVYKDGEGNYWAYRPAESVYMSLKKYTYNPYDEYVRSWAEAVREKTDEYRRYGR